MAITLRVAVSEDVNLSLEAEQSVALEAESSILVPTGELYDGAYEVTPSAYTEQVLATEGKQMLHDVTVHIIPYYETPNTEGDTVYIASEV